MLKALMIGLVLLVASFVLAKQGMVLAQTITPTPTPTFYVSPTPEATVTPTPATLPSGAPRTGFGE